jgi:hypothetical protein
MAVHGLSTYTNWGCRCDVCRAAMAAYRRDRRRKMGGRVPPEVPHGRFGTYTNYGCRCEACTAANTAYHRQRRSRTEVAG